MGQFFVAQRTTTWIVGGAQSSQRPCLNHSLPFTQSSCFLKAFV